MISEEFDQLCLDYTRDGAVFEASLADQSFYKHIEVVVSTDPEDDPDADPVQ